MFASRRGTVVSVSALVVLGAGLDLWSQPAARRPAPVVGKAARYCNPLPLPATSTDGSPQGTAFRYKIEASRDGQSFTTILDKSANSVTRYTEFNELPPTRCRYVRFTITDWPHINSALLGITEFTVFGRAVEIPKP